MKTETTKQNRRIRIRKSGIWEELYLNRKGTWSRWQDAAVFTCGKTADRFAEKYGIADYGLF